MVAQSCYFFLGLYIDITFEREREREREKEREHGFYLSINNKFDRFQLHYHKTTKHRINYSNDPNIE